MFIFVTGGARSGKSSFALGEAEKKGGRKAYVATAEALDDEMSERIAAHRKDRDDRWSTLEEPLELPEVLEGLKDGYAVIIVDCLTLWLSNIMDPRHGGEKTSADKMTENLIRAFGSFKGKGTSTPLLYVVANEVGMGIVPENRLARKFRDAAGRLNQRAAGAADEVYLIVSGLPFKLK